MPGSGRGKRASGHEVDVGQQDRHAYDAPEHAVRPLPEEDALEIVQVHRAVESKRGARESDADRGEGVHRDALGKLWRVLVLCELFVPRLIGHGRAACP